MIQELNRANLGLLREAINAAIADFGNKFGVKISTGSASFSPANATMKLEIATISTDGVVESKERTAFIREARLYGLNPEWIDKEFTMLGSQQVCKVIGLNTRCHKSPVICDSNGKRYKVSASTVKAHFDLKESIGTKI